MGHLETSEGTYRYSHRKSDLARRSPRLRGMGKMHFNLRKTMKQLHLGDIHHCITEANKYKVFEQFIALNPDTTTMEELEEISDLDQLDWWLWVDEELTHVMSEVGKAVREFRE